MALPPSKYRVKMVDNNGTLRPIVLNSTTGSSALVALSNFVLLSGAAALGEFQTEGGKKGRPEYVRKEVLMKLIESSAQRRCQECVEKKALTTTQMWELVGDCKNIIQLITNGIHFNPIFTSIRSFAFAKGEGSLFATLGTELVHGCVLDPEEDADVAQAIGSKSYDEIKTVVDKNFQSGFPVAGDKIEAKELALALEASKVAPQPSSKSASEASESESEYNAALLMKNFLDKSKNQLTPSGLTHLNVETFEDCFYVLFRNNQCTLLYKREGGTLHALRAHEEQMKTSDAAWQSLDEVYVELIDAEKKGKGGGSNPNSTKRRRDKKRMAEAKSRQMAAPETGASASLEAADGGDTAQVISSASVAPAAHSDTTDARMVTSEGLLEAAKEMQEQKEAKSAHMAAPETAASASLEAADGGGMDQIICSTSVAPVAHSEAADAQMATSEGLLEATEETQEQKEENDRLEKDKYMGEKLTRFLIERMGRCT